MLRLPRSTPAGPDPGGFRGWTHDQTLDRLGTPRVGGVQASPSSPGRWRRPPRTGGPRRAADRL